PGRGKRAVEVGVCQRAIRLAATAAVLDLYLGHAFLRPSVAAEAAGAETRTPSGERTSRVYPGSGLLIVAALPPPVSSGSGSKGLSQSRAVPGYPWRLWLPHYHICGLPTITSLLADRRPTASWGG